MVRKKGWRYKISLAQRLGGNSKARDGRGDQRRLLVVGGQRSRAQVEASHAGGVRISLLEGCRRDCEGKRKDRRRTVSSSLHQQLGLLKRSQFFSKGKSTDTTYNVVDHESNPSHYQLSANIIVIHRRIISYKAFTALVNTPITSIYLAKTHRRLHQSRCSASAG
jgi:hypothetical protein